MDSVLGRFSMSAKILFVVVLLGAVAAAIAGVGVFALDRVSGAATAIEETGDEVKLGARISQDVVELNRAEFALAADPATVKEMRGRIREIRGEFREKLQAARALAEGGDRRLLDAVAREYEAYVDDLEATLAAAERAAGVELTGAQSRVVQSVRDSRAQAQALRTTAADYVAAIEAKADRRTQAAQTTAATVMTVMLAIAGTGVAAGLGLGLLISRKGVVRPLSGAIANMNALAKGELETEIVGADRRDEVGDIARAMAVFKDGALANRRMVEQQAAEAERKAERARQVKEMTDVFEREVDEAMSTLASAAQELETTAQQMAATAEETSHQSEAVASASTQASSNVQTVASATEELTSSI